MVEQALLAALRRSKTADDVRHAEAKAAQVWWRQLEGFQMRFADAAAPAEWRSWPGSREAAGQVRGAGGSIHGDCDCTVDASDYRDGIGPVFRVFAWWEETGRLSLIWDAIEPLRPKVVRAVFGYVSGHEFERRDFLVFVHKITLERTVRLAPALAKAIVEVAVRAVSVHECVKTVRWLVRLL